jgi:hypothetical protein
MTRGRRAGHRLGPAHVAMSLSESLNCEADAVGLPGWRDILCTGIS